MGYTIMYRAIAILLFIIAIFDFFVINEYVKAFVYMFAGVLLFFKEMDIPDKTIVLLICLATNA